MKYYAINFKSQKWLGDDTYQVDSYTHYWTVSDKKDEESMQDFLTTLAEDEEVFDVYTTELTPIEYSLVVYQEVTRKSLKA